MYYSRVIMRPSCNNCPYSNLNRPGDITIGDCRGIDLVVPDFGSYEGVSLAIVNTPIGKQVLEHIKDKLVCQSINIQDVMQPPLRQCNKSNRYSEKFFTDYSEHGYKKAVQNYCGKLYPIKYYIKKWMRR